MRSASDYLLPVRAAACRLPRPGFRSLAALLLLASLAGGAVSGYRLGRSSMELGARSLERLDAQIANVEEVSTLADLDARASGTWDNYMSEDYYSVVSKGGNPRVFRAGGPFVHKWLLDPRYPMTRPADPDACHKTMRILARGPLADRIQVMFRNGDDLSQSPWIPVDPKGEGCKSSHPRGSISFRIAPPRAVPTDGGRG